jgi:hypothetical protein
LQGPDTESIDELAGEEHSTGVWRNVGNDLQGDADHQDDVADQAHHLSTDPITDGWSQLSTCLMTHFQTQKYPRSERLLGHQRTQIANWLGGSNHLRTNSRSLP